MLTAAWARGQSCLFMPDLIAGILGSRRWNAHTENHFIGRQMLALGR